MKVTLIIPIGDLLLGVAGDKCEIRGTAQSLAVTQFSLAHYFAHRRRFIILAVVVAISRFSNSLDIGFDSVSRKSDRENNRELHDEIIMFLVVGRFCVCCLLMLVFMSSTQWAVQYNGCAVLSMMS